MEVTPILSHLIGWAKTHGSCNIKYGESNADIWVCMRTWADAVFKCNRRTVLSRYSTDPNNDVAIREQPFDAIRSDVSAVAKSGGSHFLLAGFVRYPGTGNTQKVLENILYDLQLPKRCLKDCLKSVRQRQFVSDDRVPHEQAEGVGALRFDAFSS